MLAGRVLGGAVGTMVENSCQRVMFFVVPNLEYLMGMTMKDQRLETLVRTTLVLENGNVAFTAQLLLLSSLFLQPILVLSQTNGSIAVGAYLTATAEGNSSSSWLSPSGDFAFGFRPLGNNDLFLLSIWYAKIPNRTIVWYANNNPVGAPAAPLGSTVNLTAHSGLVLTRPRGEELWKSENIVGVVANGVFNDTGNFVLEDDSSKKLWESFKNPTDTILPGQIIEREGNLASRQSETNYSNGRFQLQLQPDGNLLLNSVNFTTGSTNRPYYVSATTKGTVPGSEGKQLVFNDSGYIYVLRENGGKFALGNTRVSAMAYYTRATLNFDGVFAQYVHPKTFSGNASWEPLWSLPENICLDIDADKGPGVCGLNSICTFSPADKRPKCECPRGFSLHDPNDLYGICEPDFGKNCEEEKYDVQELTNTDWRTSEYNRSEEFTADNCRESCIQDCLCGVAIYSNRTCWKKELPLSYGRADNSLHATAYIKFRKDNSTLPVPPSPSPDDKKNKQTTFLGVRPVISATALVVCLVLIAAAFSLGLYFTFQKKQVRIMQSGLNINLRPFSYQELQEATNGFTEELGRGTFGVVYKGIIQNGSQVQVAVKKLRCVKQDGDEEFKAEVNVIGKTHHKNLVRLLGYCDEGQQRLLVYELLSNGTLASFLFADVKPSWGQRIKIAFGIAKGLEYLHEECSTPIIHCDIKPQNILLDDNCTARIADFGLAKLLMMNQSHTHTAIRGTKGYVAPEWFRNMPITTKVDVYSFGVVLLEIICCRRSVDVENNCEGKAILTNWVYDCYQEGKIDAVLDHETEALHDKKNLEKSVMVAIWCIQEDPSLRPTMRKVVQMLEGVVEVHAPPCPSSYTSSA
ncbi:G-type lectin S-receptor-like serine/threonine-protein kinase LECRK3 [Prunus persica]|uniref:G-type lectin S-receptor-like serine/threonine-protein kinase LECRK3 n=1 Tax=Prunus persica TaxID=3760 RepID=UPI0009AB92C1|nr:G-type lectin S-receptor-like serine/threonine-protein kinase LECRK3 [Prunus persica]